MKIKLIVSLILIVSHSIFSTDLSNVVDIHFPENQIVDHQKFKELLTYNSKEILFEETYFFFYNGKKVFYQISYIINNMLKVQNKSLALQFDISRTRQWDNAKSAIIQYLEELSDNNFRSMNIGNGIQLKSIIQVWGSGGSADILSYNFDVQDNTISHVYIQFYDIWNIFNSWQSKLDFSSIESLSEDNSTHSLFQIIDESVRNLELNLPFFGVFNDSNVRVREYPKLESVQLGKLNEGTVVKILEMSSEKMRIDDMNDYWYKIKTKEGLIGWSYGHFINLESNFDQSEVK
jgi:hypothetical protein